jgi:signal transduction histidine kinase
MNAIMGFSDLIAQMSKEPKMREYGQYIHDASVGLLTVLNDVLIFSKIEAEKIELDMRPLEVAGVFESLMFWSAKAREKNIALNLDYADLPSEAVLADEGRLRQILSNFISNALKFTPEGGKVAVRTRIVERGRETVRIRFEVEDTGIGFADGVAAKLFKPFVQADGEISKTYGGTGLGLAISASLVTLMGGEIGASATPGKGACFWFEAPFAYSVVPLSMTA